MAVIDTFLKLMLEKRAERLVLVSDAVPYLLKGGETIGLSMPALREDMLGRIAREITGDELSGRREGTFRAADGAQVADVFLVISRFDRLPVELPRRCVRGR